MYVHYIIGIFLYAFVFVLGNFLSLPLLLQDFFIDEVVACLFGYLCLWHIYLWNIHPSVAFLPIIGFLFLSHFVLTAISQSLHIQAYNELEYDEADTINFGPNG